VTETTLKKKKKKKKKQEQPYPWSRPIGSALDFSEGISQGNQSTSLSTAAASIFFASR
jgi:hypothetical protein